MGSKKQAVRCIDIELALMYHFDYRQNFIVPNISNMMGIVPFETDMLVVTKSGYAHGFEIKVTLSDLKADFKKKHHKNFNEVRNGKVGLERFYGKFKHFSYAVPQHLKEQALMLVPEFCGVWVLDLQEDWNSTRFYCAREPKRLFDHKWSIDEIFDLTRLGTMRIYKLKYNIAENIKKNMKEAVKNKANLQEQSPDFIKTDFVFVRYLNWSGVTKQQAIAADSEDEAREWLRNCNFKEIQVKQIYFKP